MSYSTEAFIDALNLIPELNRELYFIVWTSVKISTTSVAIPSQLCMPPGLLFAIKKFPGKSVIQNILNTLEVIIYK